ncbi:tryptophan-rich sensory protein [Intrasporangium sp.]|uniref:tryptophan-rich sensory protein n=1 Tax=Intrasporangium sp. TaxID=1925024 RepID=UPI00293AC13B|nr:tryptophan-rich sensory protein [Intrasporangium sp.]MDV3221312.1 tryptophan-rich sensory protein [Intrasporangium sp.]
MTPTNQRAQQATGPTTGAATPSPTGSPERTALVTGASGYIGGQLVPRLLAEGWRVRVLTRRAGSLDDRPWADRVEVVVGDAADRGDLGTALSGIRTAYYLVHSMDDRPGFAERDREAATVFGEVAREQGVQRIVYLGGLHPDGEELSPHLASRVEVGRILLASGVPTAVLQAAVVLGDGSVSFDMLRYLTTRLPAMVAPKWLDNRIQPIAIDDVVTLLAGAADLPADVNRTFDIGGPEVLTYREMIQRFAAVTGLRRRLVVTVPVLTPRLASHWVGLVTPIGAGIAKPLVGSLVHEVVAKESDLLDVVEVPGGVTGFDEAVRRAMEGTTPDTALRNLAITGAAVTTSAVIGSLATKPDSRWYRSLDLPAWQPPKAAFPIVWTLLYADIAASAAAALTGIDRRPDEEGAGGRHAGGIREAVPSARQSYLAALGTNLVLNSGWSLLFWRGRTPGGAALESAVLTASGADLVRRTTAVNSVAGRALVPYVVWTGFATVLSAEIHRRNRNHRRHRRHRR